MNHNLNEIVLAKILSIIPENIKPVNFFMDVLDLSKESAYRRLRGEKALSFEDIYKLSLVLDFSLDEISENSESNRFVFNHIGAYQKNPENNLIDYFYYYEESLKVLVEAENVEIVCTLNHLQNVMLVEYKNLFKFFYFRWIHQMKEVPLDYFYSDLTIPTELKELCGRLEILHKKLKKVTYIIDKNLHLNMIREMQYFHMRNLVTEEELDILKKEYLQYLEDSVGVLKKGADDNGTQFDVYLSLLNVSSTTTYSTCDNNEKSNFWHYYGYPIFTDNKKITSRHRYWIDSLKKYSTLISQSNELVLADFFNRQRLYLDNIADDIML